MSLRKLKLDVSDSLLVAVVAMLRFLSSFFCSVLSGSIFVDTEEANKFAEYGKSIFNICQFCHCN